MKSARSHGLYFAIHHSVFLKQDFLGEREHHASMWLDKQEEEMAQNILEAEWEGIEGVVIETSLDLYPLDETKTEDHPVNLAQKQKRDKYIAQTRRIFFKQIPQLRKRYAFLSTLSHEMVHAASETTLFIEDRGLDERRGGFQNYNDRTKQASFVGLNEAVVQKMSWQILLRNHDVLDKEDGKRLGDLTKFLVESGVGMFEEDFSFYDDYIIVLDAIIKGVAEVRGMTFEEVWREFKTSYLKGGKLDFLKDLEQIFGRYSFKILSKLNEKNSSLVGDYFREKDSEKRREIGQKILEG
ncbi:MAG: hypothetical protein NTU97_00510 [Candidatus Magasanikbacteria bacterium]|nr:hypothetical protein [Candidatus Magasanikbacteria bacterium]